MRELPGYIKKQIDDYTLMVNKVIDNKGYDIRFKIGAKDINFDSPDAIRYGYASPPDYVYYIQIDNKKKYVDDEMGCEEEWEYLIEDMIND